ncbi:MAG: hypothetical protein O6761_06420 [Thaumarchaeota archaeon]|nr:hypothetical protein [Nitrososphaerota archaeon]
MQEALSNGNFFKFASQVAVEKISCLFALDVCIIQPIIINENRSIEPVGNPSNYNLTLTYIDELKANFTIFPQVNNVRIEINGTQLVTVTLDNVNVTEGGGGDWIYIGAQNVNRIEVNQRTNFTVYFPQTPDTAFATHGKSLEGNFINNFTQIEFDRIHGLAEHYNILSANIQKIINFTTIDQQKAYEIALKLKIPQGFITPDSNLTKVGQAYIDGIGNSTTFAEIFDKIEQRIRNETGSGGAGDNPDFGIPPGAEE